MGKKYCHSFIKNNSD